VSRWVVHARASFDARHGLTRYLGRPEASHSHRWEVELRAGVDRLNDDGYALDFVALERMLAEWAAPLDGSDLNADPLIGAPSPTAERVAEVLAETLEPEVAQLGGTLLSVTVWEGPDNRVDLNLA